MWIKKHILYCIYYFAYILIIINWWFRSFMQMKMGQCIYNTTRTRTFFVYVSKLKKHCSEQQTCLSYNFFCFTRQRSHHQIFADWQKRIMSNNMFQSLEKYYKWEIEILRKAKDEMLSLCLEERKNERNIERKILFSLVWQCIKYWVKGIFWCWSCIKSEFLQLVFSIQSTCF